MMPQVTGKGGRFIYCLMRGLKNIRELTGKTRAGAVKSLGESEDSFGIVL
jgi:hypothetical protein